MSNLDENKLKQSIFLIALFALGGFLLWLVNGFVSTALAAVIFYILFRKPFFYLTEKKHWRKQITIILVLLISFVLLVLPVFLTSLLLAGKIAYVIQHYEELLQVLHGWSDQAKGYIGVDIFSQDSVNKFTTMAADTAPKLITATLDIIADILVLYFLLYFMFNGGRKMESNVREYLPFRPENNQLLLTELKRQTLANAIGVPSITIVVALFGGFGYWLFGVNNPFFWGILTGICGVVPVIGIGLIWIPVVVYLFLSGHPGKGLGLIAYCAIGFTVVENGFRIVALKKLGDTHPLITFFGVLIGLQIFGFVGLIFGPLLISYFILLLRIYRNEYIDETPE